MHADRLLQHFKVLLLRINGPLKELLSDLKIFKYNASVGERFKRISTCLYFCAAKRSAGRTRCPHTDKGDLSLWLMLSNKYIASIPTSSKDSTAQRDS